MSVLRIATVLTITAIPAAAELYCSPERPVVFTGESVKLRAWPDHPAAVLNYKWAVDAGNLTTSGNDAEWHPAESTGQGRYQITVTTPTRVGSESCTIVIFYQERPIYRGTGGVLEPGASLLQQGSNEPRGFGVYSYVLFGEPSNNENSERYRKTLAAYRSMVIPLEQMEAYFDRGQLNVVQVPVLVKPKPKQQLNEDELLAGYDFARARSLLDRVKAGLRRGPYLVSSLSPLPTLQPGSNILIQDLSLAPPSVVDYWVREFLNHSAQTHSWNVNDLRTFLLRLRTVIAIAASGYDQVKSGLDQYITLVETGK